MNLEVEASVVPVLPPVKFQFSTQYLRDKIITNIKVKNVSEIKRWSKTLNNALEEVSNSASTTKGIKLLKKPHNSKKEHKPKIRLAKCPGCKKQGLLISIFGSICIKCLYEN